MVSECVLLELPEFRQDLSSLGLVNRAGHNHDTCVRSNGMNDLHIEFGLGLPARYVFFIGGGRGGLAYVGKYFFCVLWEGNISFKHIPILLSKRTSLLDDIDSFLCLFV